MPKTSSITQQVCPKCRYLYITGETHVCPTRQEVSIRERLITQALTAEQLFTLNELERHAQEHSNGKTEEA